MKDICDMRVTFSRFSGCFDMECLMIESVKSRSMGDEVGTFSWPDPYTLLTSYYPCSTDKFKLRMKKNQTIRLFIMTDCFILFVSKLFSSLIKCGTWLRI